MGALVAISIVLVANHAAAAGVAGAVIGFYQSHISGLRYGHCRFSPSCSQYAIEAIRSDGLFLGSARAADRLVRCNSSSSSHYARGSGGRLADLPGTESLGPRQPRMPDWLLPARPVDGMPARDDSVVMTSERRRWADEVASFAASLAAEGDCDRAATEYQRLAHLLGPSVRAWAHGRAGDCYFRAGDWAVAMREYEATCAVAATDTARAAAAAMAAACHFNAGGFVACEALLAPLAAEHPQALGGLGLCEMSRGRWGAAEARLSQASRATGDSLLSYRLGRVAAWCERGPTLPHRRPGLATALSTVVPGSGQMYAGRASDGFRHLVLNGALIWTIVRLARDGHYPAAYLVMGLELPFYAGNVIGAGRSARESDAANRMRFVARAIEDAGRTTAGVPGR